MKEAGFFLSDLVLESGTKKPVSWLPELYIYSSFCNQPTPFLFKLVCTPKLPILQDSDVCNTSKQTAKLPWSTKLLIKHFKDTNFILGANFVFACYYIASWWCKTFPHWNKSQQKIFRLFPPFFCCGIETHVHLRQVGKMVAWKRGGVGLATSF